MLRPLNVYINSELQDHRTVATEASINSALLGGYQFFANCGWVETSDSFSRAHLGVEALELWWHEAQADSFTTATRAGKIWAEANGYVRQSFEGWVYRNVESGMLLGQYLQASSGDRLLTRTDQPLPRVAAPQSPFVLDRADGTIFPLPGAGMRTFYNMERRHTINARSEVLMQAAAGEGYTFVRTHAGFGLPTGRPDPNLLPMRVAHHTGRNEYATYATDAARSQLRDAGYVELDVPRGREGWVVRDGMQNASMLPVLLTHHARNNDYALTVGTPTRAAAEAEASRRGYAVVSLEGWILPEPEGRSVQGVVSGSGSHRRSQVLATLMATSDRAGHTTIHDLLVRDLFGRDELLSRLQVAQEVHSGFTFFVPNRNREAAEVQIKRSSRGNLYAQTIIDNDPTDNLGALPHLLPNPLGPQSSDDTDTGNAEPDTMPPDQGPPDSDD